MKLVVVESPAKCNKISGFLGSEYIVKASYGHFRDLKKKELGVDVDNNFKPEYVLSDDKKQVIKDLKSTMKKCDELILAADNDREGEAIAFHLDAMLNKGKLNSQRVLFNEITKSALVSAVSKPTCIDINLFYAQQARRIIDRLVGFILTPILWKNIQNNYSKGQTLSAGRVQSVVNKLIYEKEQIIQKFEKSPYFNIKGDLEFKKYKIPVKLINRVNSYEKTTDILMKSKTDEFLVTDIKKKESIENPRPPFITSSLQTEAHSKLSMSSKQCMMVAQKLYEKGHITYMRTDSTVISQEAHDQIKNLVTDKFGEDYYRYKSYSNKKNAQEAHECCRPTNINLTPTDFSSDIYDEKRLYDLIWRRCIASQMKPVKKDILDVKISLDDNIFQSTYDKIIFLGFMIVYQYGKNNTEYNNETSNENNIEHTKNPLNKLKIGDSLGLFELSANEKYTIPESRYNDGSLVKKLEELGIGRPSTYSAMINGVLDKNLATKTKIEGIDIELRNMIIRNNIEELIEKKEIVKYGKDVDKLITTEMGITVHNFLEKWYDNIINYQFTANLEKQLDLVASGKEDWVNVVRNVYNLLVNNKKYVELSNVKNKEKVTKILGINPDNGKQISVNLGQYGLYLKEHSTELGEKDRNVSLKEERINEITLEMAIELLKYPKNLGLYNGLQVYLHNGPYGIYMKYNNKNYSIGDHNVNSLDSNKIKEIIDGYQNKSNNEIHKIGSKIVILKGIYGPYIRYNNKTNHPIYLDNSINEEEQIKYLKDLTKEQCMNIINLKKVKTTSKKK